MNITVGTQYSQIETDNPKIITALANIYAKRIKGAEFSPAYRRRGWDGKKHFIDKTGKFRTGLLPFILRDLEKIDCIPTIAKKRLEKLEPYTPEAFSKTYKFDPYEFQVDLVKQALKSRRGIIKSPTGSGKTLIMAMLIAALRETNPKILILFNAKQLLTQTYDFFVKTLKFDNIGICFGEGFILNDIMLCTVQSIDRLMIHSNIEDYSVLMVDEAHLFANGKITLAAIESFPNADWRFGFTATLPDDEIAKYNLYANFGEVIEESNTQDLIAQGHLTKPRIKMLRFEPPIDKMSSCEETSFFTIYDKYIINGIERNAIILSQIQKIREESPDAKVVVITKNLKHTTYLNDNIKDSVKIEGEDDIQTRYQIIRKFREPGFSCLVGTKILETGVNIEEITHLIMARGLKSESAAIQVLGRGLRKHKGKTGFIFYDIYDYGIDYLEKHSKARKKAYEKEGHKVELE